MTIPNRNHGMGMRAGTRMGPRHWRPPRGGPAQRHIRASSRGMRRSEKSRVPERREEVKQYAPFGKMDKVNNQ